MRTYTFLVTKISEYPNSNECFRIHTKRTLFIQAQDSFYIIPSRLALLSLPDSLHHALSLKRLHDKSVRSKL